MTSDRFIEAIGTSHTSAAKVQWWNDKTTLLDTDLTDHVNIIDGSVSIDRNASVRRSMSLELVVDDYELFRTIIDPVYGYSVKVFRGIVFPDGITEYEPIGVFVTNSYNITELEDTFKVSLSGYDLSNKISRNKWSTPYKIAAGTNYTDALRNLLIDRTTGFTLVFNGVAVPDVTPDLFYGANEDPWECAMKLAEASGTELYFDATGIATTALVPNPMTVLPRLSLTASPDAVRIGPLSRGGDLSDTYNGVICRASAPWLLFPIEGSAWDDDPFSPTYRYGPFGQKPTIIDDATVTTVAMCNAMALTELRKIVGKAEQIDFSTLVDPRIEGGDVVVLYDPIDRTSSVHVIQTYSIPLRGGSSSGTVKTQRKYVT